ncbi:hypothetical protein OL548_31435 [Lysinibacillus sp. MHQ-1]|nr:hypothetical protein OL548_31435 [Lysinibacillus sp. MHQ-1]
MDLVPLTIERAYMTFLFPFAYQIKDRQKIGHTLLEEGFSFF